MDCKFFQDPPPPQFPSDTFQSLPPLPHLHLSDNLNQ